MVSDWGKGCDCCDPVQEAHEVDQGDIGGLCSVQVADHPQEPARLPQSTGSDQVVPVPGELGAEQEVVDEDSKHKSMEDHMRCVVEAHQAASGALHDAHVAQNKAERKLWIAKAVAKRTRSKVDRNAVMCFMEAQAETEHLSNEIRLYADELSSPENQAEAKRLGFQGPSSRR